VFFICQEGGCSAPVAAHAEIQDDNLSILAGVWSLDGSQKKLRTIQVNLLNKKDKCVMKLNLILFKKINVFV